jgi:acyl-CoA synthetase (AMP-forming)/AMP-acid ligase II
VCIFELTTARQNKEPGIGRPINNVHVRILEEDGRECPPDQPGIVAIRTPLLADGYIGDTEATRRAFHHGWFYPGDIGKLTPDGEFVVIGRIRDQLNLGGIKANAADIDATIQTLEAVSDGICFHQTLDIGTDILAAVIRLKSTGEPEKVAAAIRTICKKRHGSGLVPRQIYFVDSVPRNESGKPLRRECVALVRGMRAW